MSFLLGMEEQYLINKGRIIFLEQHVGVSLPNVEQWEYAAKARDPYVFAGAINPNDCAWYEENAQDQTQDVMKLTPNRFGLYDLSGNVWERVYDVQDSCSFGVGGSFKESYSGIQIGAKIDLQPETIRSDLGFRPIVPIFW